MANLRKVAYQDMYSSSANSIFSLRLCSREQQDFYLTERKLTFSLIVVGGKGKDSGCHQEEWNSTVRYIASEKLSSLIIHQNVISCNVGMDYVRWKIFFLIKKSFLHMKWRQFLKVHANHHNTYLIYYKSLNCWNYLVIRPILTLLD